MQIDYTLAPKFSCNKCMKLHDNEDNASHCCMPQVQEVFLCPICEATHEDQSDAATCCDMVSEVYICPFCQSQHEEEEGALECCGERFEAGEVPRFRCPKTVDMFRESA